MAQHAEDGGKVSAADRLQKRLEISPGAGQQRIKDKLHQPYRMPLMPGSKEVFEMARLCGAKAVYVSGAGSTVMAVGEKATAEKFYSKLEKGLELLEGLDGCEAFTLLRLDADNTGATVE